MTHLRKTPHTCLACRQTFWTFTANGFSQAFQNHMEIECTASIFNFAGAAGEPFDL